MKFWQKKFKGVVILFLIFVMILVIIIFNNNSLSFTKNTLVGQAVTTPNELKYILTMRYFVNSIDNVKLTFEKVGGFKETYVMGVGKNYGPTTGESITLYSPGDRKGLYLALSNVCAINYRYRFHNTGTKIKFEVNFNEKFTLKKGQSYTLKDGSKWTLNSLSLEKEGFLNAQYTVECSK